MDIDRFLGFVGRIADPSECGDSEGSDRQAAKKKPRHGSPSHPIFPEAARDFTRSGQFALS